MFGYIVHRLMVMVPTLLAISALVFIIIQLPPGDYLETMMAELQARGEAIDESRIAFLRAEYGLDKPLYEQYFIWLWGLLQGDMGWSFEHNRPVSEVVQGRVFMTFVVSMSSIIFIWVVSFIIGLYTATHQYSLGDHVATFIGYIGLATPNSLLALIVLYHSNRWFGTAIGGLMDPQYIDQPWSWAKVGSVMGHLWIPVIIIGTSGTAGMIQRLRANLLDELQKQYVVTGRAKGLPARRLLWKYPLRMALNPFIADIGNLLPEVISGAALVSIVLSLDTTGPMLVSALQAQDMYLAGSFLMFLALLTVIGTLISDMALALLDPRIRLTGGASK